MYKVNKAQFMLCAAWKSQFPDTSLPEVFVCGRSNVGKSSFINTMTNRKGLAKVSGNPGKTRTLNFFNINDQLRFVDVPGYGYANVSQKMQAQFGEMVDDYMEDRPNLRAVILIVDHRHKPTGDDVTMYEYVKYYELPVLIIATKEDKVKRNDLKKSEKLIKNTLNFDEENDYFVSFSSLQKKGIDKAWDIIIKLCS